MCGVGVAGWISGGGCNGCSIFIRQMNEHVMVIQAERFTSNYTLPYFRIPYNLKVHCIEKGCSRVSILAITFSSSCLFAICLVFVFFFTAL